MNAKDRRPGDKKTMNKAKFTPQQIEDWKAYEAVRQSGEINMLEMGSGAVLARISRESYAFSLKNYNELKDQAMTPNV